MHLNAVHALGMGRHMMSKSLADGRSVKLGQQCHPQYVWSERLRKSSWFDLGCLEMVQKDELHPSITPVFRMKWCCCILLDTVVPNFGCCPG